MGLNENDKAVAYCQRVSFPDIIVRNCLCHLPFVKILLFSLLVQYEWTFALASLVANEIKHAL